MRYFVAFCLAVCVSMSCQENKMLSIHIDSYQSINFDNKVNGYFTIHDRGKKIETQGTAKYRGGFSSGFKKKSYEIELKEKYSFEGMQKDDDWVLNANYIDKTFMRHKISYDLFREMHTNNIAPSSRYCTVYESNDYQGLYVLMEKINAGMLKLNKKDSLACLYKDPPIFTKDSLQLKSTENVFHQKFPKFDSFKTNQHIHAFRHFLLHSSDEEFMQNINNWIDINNVIDWHLLLLLSNNSDGILKNFYLYKKDSQTPFRIAIWDYDHSYGRDGDNEFNMLSTILDCNRSILFSRLMNIEESSYPQQLKSRYHELRKSNLFSEFNMEKLWNDNVQSMGSELEKNFEKWPYDGEYYHDDNDFEAEKEIFFTFLQKRFMQLDARFQFTEAVN